MVLAKNFKPYVCEKHDYIGAPSRCGGCRSEARKALLQGVPDTRKTVVLTTNGRTCLKCGEAKSWDEFAKDVHGYNQKTATCKSCRNVKSKKLYDANPHFRRSGIKNRPDKLRRDYGIESWDEVLKTFDAQFGRCANRACGKEISLEVKGVGGNRAVIDHDHSTGRFRALLCSKCNTGLGVIESDPNIFLGLMEYKAKHTKTD